MKKIIRLILVFILLSAINTQALTPTSLERTKENNYGVNKKWKITNNNIENVLDTPYVDASEEIYDYSEILKEEEIEYLKERIENFKNETNMEIVVVTKNIPYQDDKVNKEFAADFYDYNDFGLDEEDYSGILFFRNTYEQDPYYYMLTSGKAQLYYGQTRVDEILDNMYREISSGMYYDGIITMIDYLNSYYNEGIDPELEGYTLDDTGHLKRPGYKVPWIIVLVLSIILTISEMIRLIKKNKMIIKATEAKEYLDLSSINITKSEDNFLSSHTSSYTESSSSSGGGGGGFSGSSGGGHGGGGRHG